MKKIVLLIAAFAGTISFVSAQKLPSSKVPAEIKNAFGKAHPEIKSVNWEKEKDYFEAGFELRGHKISEVYTAKGVLLETETTIKVSELPVEVTTYVSGHYKGAAVKEAAKIVKADGTIRYEAEVKGKDLIFDAKGNLVKN